MIIFYNKNYNIDLGVLNALHPFDGKKFGHVYDGIVNLEGISIKSPEGPITQDEIDQFMDASLRQRVAQKDYVLQALEIPYLPLIPYSFLDKHILLPMRWGVSGTLQAARMALQGNNSWNLSGGYHHASRTAGEGFCLYNDIGITVDILMREKLLNDSSRILIIDVDAHHGNGNAGIFMEQKNVTLLDIYNNAIYPAGTKTKARVNINLPLQPGTGGDLYLNKLSDGLSSLQGSFDLAFVVAGTDVLDIDPLGGLNLTIADCVERDSIVLKKLTALSTPAVVVGGGGYSKQSANAITESLKVLYKL